MGGNNVWFKHAMLASTFESSFLGGGRRVDLRQLRMMNGRQRVGKKYGWFDPLQLLDQNYLYIGILHTVRFFPFYFRRFVVE